MYNKVRVTLDELSEEQQQVIKEKFIMTQALSKIFNNVMEREPEEFQKHFNKYQEIFYSVEGMFRIDKKRTIKEMYNLMIGLSRKVYAKNIITCKTGCSFCCHQNVDVSQEEADIIKDFLKANNIELSQAQKDTIQEQLGLDNHTRVTMNNSACIFLKESKCSIYDVRPISCRKYFSCGDPNLCNTKSNFGTVGIYGDFEMECMASAIISLSKSSKNINEYFI